MTHLLENWLLRRLSTEVKIDPDSIEMIYTSSLKEYHIEEKHLPEICPVLLILKGTPPADSATADSGLAWMIRFEDCTIQ